MHTFKSFITELSKTTLAKYISASAEDSRHHAIVAGSGEKAAQYETEKGQHTASKSLRRIASKNYAFSHKRVQGVKLAAKKLAKEEVQLQELKSSTLGRYIKTAAADLTHQSALMKQYKKDYPGNNSPTEQKLVDQKVRAVKKRNHGIGQATNRLVNRVWGHSRGKDN